MQTVSGTVYDQQGAVIPNVGVTFSIGNRKIATTVSDSDGKYKVGIKSGLYKITFKQLGFTGFNKFTINGYYVPGEANTREFSLDVCLTLRRWRYYKNKSKGIQL